MDTYCAFLVCGSGFYSAASQSKRNVASPVLYFGVQLYIRFFSLNNSCLRDYFNPIFVPKLKQNDTTNIASSASYLELYPDKLTVRVV